MSSRNFDGNLAGPRNQFLFTANNPIYDTLPSCCITAWVRPIRIPVSDAAPVLMVAIKNPNPHTELSGPLLSIAADPSGNAQLFGEVEFDGVDVAFGNSNVPGGVLNANTWTFISMNFNISGDKLIHLYTGGVEVSSYVDPYTAGVGNQYNDSGAGWAIGNDNIDSSNIFVDAFDGQISDVRIYNVTLSAAQLAIVKAGGEPLPANIVGKWLLGSGTFERDLSGNNNNAFSYNGTTVSSQTPPIYSGPFVPGVHVKIPVYDNTLYVDNPGIELGPEFAGQSLIVTKNLLNVPVATHGQNDPKSPTFQLNPTQA